MPYLLTGRIIISVRNLLTAFTIERISSSARQVSVLGIFHSQVKVYAMFEPVLMVAVGEVASRCPLRQSKTCFDTGTGWSAKFCTWHWENKLELRSDVIADLAEEK